MRCFGFLGWGRGSRAAALQGRWGQHCRRPAHLSRLNAARVLGGAALRRRIQGGQILIPGGGAMRPDGAGTPARA